MWLFAVAAAAFVALPAASARAQAQTFLVNMNGQKEFVGGQFNRGDLDATGVGSITLNPGTGGTTGSAVFDITLANIDFPLTAYHIHTGAAGVQGGVLLDFGSPEAIRTGNLLSGTVPNLSSANITTILANPANFYLNIHNGPFGSGAVRDQLLVPEPGALALLGVAGLATLRRRRRAA